MSLQTIGSGDIFKAGCMQTVHKEANPSAGTSGECDLVLCGERKELLTPMPVGGLKFIRSIVPAFETGSQENGIVCGTRRVIILNEEQLYVFSLWRENLCDVSH